MVIVSVLQPLHVAHHIFVQYPGSAGHDLVVFYGGQVFVGDDAFFGEEIMLVLQFIGIVQEEELYVGERKEAGDRDDLMNGSGVFQVVWCFSMI